MYFTEFISMNDDSENALLFFCLHFLFVSCKYEMYFTEITPSMHSDDPGGYFAKSLLSLLYNVKGTTAQIPAF